MLERNLRAQANVGAFSLLNFPVRIVPSEEPPSFSTESAKSGHMRAPSAVSSVIVRDVRNLRPRTLRCRRSCIEPIAVLTTLPIRPEKAASHPLQAEATIV